MPVTNNIISDIDPGKVTQGLGQTWSGWHLPPLGESIAAVNKAITSRPYVHIPLIMALGALIGNKGSQAAANMFTDVAMSGSPDKEQTKRDMEKNPRIRTIGTVLGGLAGLALAMPQHLDTAAGSTWTSRLESLTQKDYWKQHPERLQQWQQQNQEAIKNWQPRMLNVPSQSGWLSKYQSAEDGELEWGDVFSQGASDPTIPLHSSLALIHGDEYLNPFQRSSAGSLLLQAQGANKAPAFSRDDLVQSGIDKGLDFTRAYAFGQGVGWLLGLPEPLTSRISKAGGLANAIIRSGIFQPPNSGGI
jgi:hypothetical protein